ncbi:hypothetical protein SAMN05216319_1795 [Duganella sp. CF402]|uniref:hypothetical protein n=1 Tax=unclassified Duganella TaxID=2636909 RepID=UPI0008B6F76A|nr:MULTISPECIES: hypothetical protein [unclassified Duganella]RZT09762.1 hypothetical protein EV582_1833 [Duganella sp. BK701]SEL43933.1 hypothetical protein SAMN05216319_1795 [Duganella sp. CF402]
MTIRPRRKAPPAVYALQRQMAAVRRTVTALTVDESQRAARWAQAWYQVVQRKLDQLQHRTHLH